MQLLWIALGGATGALCRFGIGKAMTSLNPHPRFSVGILAANLIGCFLMGALFILISNLDAGPREALTAFVLTGFLGSLTTYSTYMLEFVSLAQDGVHKHALGYIGVHFVGGVIALGAGLKLALVFQGSR